MRRRILTLVLLAGFLALAACAAQEAPKERAAPPGPAAAPQAAPAAPAAKPAWEQEWERVLAAAKREGSVAVAGFVGAESRNALVPFEKRYGITVEYLGSRGPEFVARLMTERAAGQYLWDINLGGLTHWIPYLDRGVLAPLEPALILPAVKDPKNWWEGKLQWLDKERRILAMSFQTTSGTYINTKLDKPGDLKSYKDLLDPKWKGKLLIDDPTLPGPGQSQFAFFYVHPQLGPDFIRALAKQDVTVSRDRRQQLEWLALGRFPILLGGSRGTALPMIREGLPIVNLDPRGVKEGAAVTVGTGHLFLLNKAPHPNAAKVFVNWMLGNEGQASYLRSQGIPSLRLDVANDWVEPWELPQEGYVRMVGPEDHEVRAKVRDLVKQVFGQ